MALLVSENPGVFFANVFYYKNVGKNKKR